MSAKTNFQQVQAMNEAFGNAKGDPSSFDRDKIRGQCKNIFHEGAELLKALGANPEQVAEFLNVANQISYSQDEFDLKEVRDALCDIHVYAYGAHHLMGIDADKDVQAVVDGNMTRFIKDESDKVATIAMHAAKGVTAVRFEGDYPTMVMKSTAEQPDAPVGKFLKSASYREPVFYPVGN